MGKVEGGATSFSHQDLEDGVWNGKELKSKTIDNTVGELINALEEIGFPWSVENANSRVNIYPARPRPKNSG
jgi:hypothetical protein